MQVTCDINDRFDARAAQLCRRGFRYGSKPGAKFASFTRKNKTVCATKVMRADDAEWTACLADMDATHVIVVAKNDERFAAFEPTVEHIFTSEAEFSEYLNTLASFDAMDEIVSVDYN